jgi:hypothetical protein
MELERIIAKKSRWREKKERGLSYLCPQCESKRVLAFDPRTLERTVLIRSAVSALMFVCVSWQWWGLRGAVAFVPLWICFSVTSRIRARAQMTCRECGFDPYLFLRDREQARKKVEQTLLSKRERLKEAREQAAQKPKSQQQVNA